MKITLRMRTAKSSVKMDLDLNNLNLSMMGTISRVEKRLSIEVYEVLIVLGEGSKSRTCS